VLLSFIQLIGHALERDGASSVTATKHVSCILFADAELAHCLGEGKIFVVDMFLGIDCLLIAFVFLVIPTTFVYSVAK
jgi:hypothetical protein